jgi:hypothetical protein
MLRSLLEVHWCTLHSHHCVNPKSNTNIRLYRWHGNGFQRYKNCGSQIVWYAVHKIFYNKHSQDQNDIQKWLGVQDRDKIDYNSKD